MMAGMRDRLLRALLAWLALYHLAVGVLSLASPAAALEFGSRVYGIAAQPAPAVLALMRPLGAYAVAIGFLSLCGAWDPRQNRVAVDVLALLMLLRLGHRTLAAGALEEGLGIGSGQNALNAGLLLVQTAGLLVLRPRSGER